MADLADFANRLQHANLVIGSHDGDQNVFFVDGALQVVEVNEAVCFYRQIGDAIAVLLETLAGVENCLVSVTWVMMWLPRSRYISAMPLIARLSLSVPRK